MSKGIVILAALVGMALPMWAQRPHAAYAAGASTRALRTVAWQDRDCDRDRDHDRDRWRHNRDRYRNGHYPYYGQYGRQYPSRGYTEVIRSGGWYTTQYPYGGYTQYPYGGYSQYPYGGYNQYPYGGYNQSPYGSDPYGYGRGGYGYRGVLAPEWQAKFDSYYQRWLQYRATNNVDEIVSMERRMRDIMVNYRIPPNTPFDQVASPGVGYAYYRR